MSDHFSLAFRAIPPASARRTLPGQVAVAAAFVVRIRGASGFSFAGQHRGMTGRMEQHQPPEES